MGKFIDLSGKKFNRLTVINRVDTPKHVKNTKHIYWLCKCDCGKKVMVSGSNLKSNQVLSCGCYQKEKASLSYGESNLNRLFRSYKYHAKERNLCFELSKEEFFELTKENCFYCGRFPSQKIKSERANGDYVYNGIDRIDTSKGYTIENTVSCCGQCNKAKLTTNQTNFFEWIKMVYNNLNDKGLL